MDKNDGRGGRLVVFAICMMLLADIRAELTKQTRLQTMAVCVTVPLPECKKEGVK